MNILKPIKNNIDQELKDKKAWIVWKIENTEGKQTKVPYNAKTGSRAKSNDPETWTDIETAYGSYEKDIYDGIGFVLSKENPLVGIDLDHCVDPETGKIDPWAQKIVDGLPTYWELSPSGTGLRAFVKGKLPPEGRKKGNIELYEAGRYLTVTGHKLNGNQIKSLPEELNKLHAETFKKVETKNQPMRQSFNNQELLTKAFESKHGHKIRLLFNGDTSDYSSPSEADQALCNYLAFWFDNNYAAIDQVFRSSGLMREKWNEKHHADGRTYGQATIGKAISATNETYQSRAPKEPKQEEKILVINKFSPRPWVVKLRTKFNLRSDFQKRLWIYNTQLDLWKENAETILEAELRKNLLGDELLKQHYVAEILADVKSLSFSQTENLEPPPHLIPFKNIIYNIKTDEELKYSPEYFFTSKLNVNYNREAICPFIDSTFSQLVPEPDHLFELTAYCLYRAYPYQKWFFLYGSGGNGKTVYTMILESLLGKENIRSITADQFVDNRFAVADLHGKFANLAGEMSYNTLEKTAILKQLVGGDLLRAERKYKEPFYFNNYAKLIFNTNSLPKTTDKTRAFYRRLYLIEFPNRFEGSDKEDKLLFQKITQNELEGLAIKSLGFLLNLYDRGFFFTNDRGVDDLTKEYEQLTNPLITFLAETTEQDATGTIPKWQLRDLFVQWLSDKSFRIWNDTQIGKEMKTLGYDDGRQNFDGSTQRCWFGIRWFSTIGG
ncbi:MAG TPA: phage/plasmid primase, P4 family [Anaerolineae bacterium]|nr:phage/plasmid primase, P4 family [Anaerolineae bacterium]